MMERHSILAGKCYRDSFGAIYRVVGFDGNGVLDRNDRGLLVERQHFEAWSSFLEDLEGEVQCPSGT
jgi:hypothetical protein